MLDRERIFAPNAPLFFLCGPCVVESESMAMFTGETIRQIADRLGVLIIYKSSFDKANRSGALSYRGLGIEEGLRILQRVKREFDLPIVTDVHEVDQIAPVAEVVDVLQTPAFLARQTDFIQAVAKAGKPVNIKKGQFMAPDDMANVVAKANLAHNEQIMLCERGTTFGYHNLVVDFRGLAIMRRTGCPIVFDATHSVQLPGAQGDSSGGEREFVPLLARAAVAAGVNGVFMESHPNPDEALCDGPNSWPMEHLESLLRSLVDLHHATSQG